MCVGERYISRAEKKKNSRPFVQDFNLIIEFGGLTSTLTRKNFNILLFCGQSFFTSRVSRATEKPIGF
jgi:hypothetical protein